MKKDVLVYLEDILDAMEKAETFIEGLTYKQFEADLRTNFAVVRAIEIIGEATKRLPTALRDQYPDIPWKDMAGMRDVIIHGYDNVNLQIVWGVVKQDIPEIKPQIRQILGDSEG
ncbi:MAG: DUF86 domain-containing protein [Anaerolineales bacterium]|jgi:uncharacterized protein with HEPN domain